jgi:hypothetical protein
MISVQTFPRMTGRWRRRRPASYFADFRRKDGTMFLSKRREPEMPARPADGATELEWFDYNRAWDDWIVARDKFWADDEEGRFRRYQARKLYWPTWLALGLSACFLWIDADKRDAALFFVGSFVLLLAGVFLVATHNIVERIARVVDRLEADVEARKQPTPDDIGRRQKAEGSRERLRAELVRLVGIKETPEQLEAHLEAARLARVEHYNATGECADMTAEERKDREALGLLRRYRRV